MKKRSRLPSITSLFIASEVCIDFLDQLTVNIKSTAENNNYKFSFDRSFDSNSTQSDIYEFAARPLIDSRIINIIIRCF